MKNTDDFMRQKFDNDDSANRFEFREEYWEQAQAMLEADEARRRKRRRWLLWWVFTGAMAVVVAVYSGRRQEQMADLPAEGTKAGKNGKSSRQEQISGGYSDGLEAIQTQGDTLAAGFIFEKKTPVADSAFLKNKIENQGFGTKNGAAEKRLAPEQLPKKGSSKPTNKPQARLEADPSISAPPSSVFNGEKLADTQKNDPNDVYVSSLPTLLRLLDLPPRALDTLYIITAAREIKPLRERRFTFGLAAAASLTQSSPDGKRLGGTGGAFATYRLVPHWSLTAGAQWRFLPGDWRADSIAVENSTQLRYGFGFQQDEFVMETRGLHFLEFPIGLHWRRGAFGAEAGVVSGFLVGVQGRLIQRHSESLQNGVAETRSRVWLDKSPYRNTYVTPFLGAEWRATQRLGLSLRGVYHPGSLAKENVDSPPPGSLFWLDAGIRFRF